MSVTRTSSFCLLVISGRNAAYWVYRNSVDTSWRSFGGRVLDQQLAPEIVVDILNKLLSLTLTGRRSACHSDESLFGLLTL